MKKYVKKEIRPVEVEVEVWMAKDGAEFTSEEECRAYEDEGNLTEKMIEQRYDALIKSTVSAGGITDWYPEDHLDVIYIRDEQDKQTVNQLLDRFYDGDDDKRVQSEDIGTLILVVFSQDKDYAYYLGQALNWYKSQYLDNVKMLIEFEKNHSEVISKPLMKDMKKFAVMFEKGV